MKAPPSTAAARIPEVGPNYRVVKTLGEGGFGAVYEAVEVLSKQRVALKALVRMTPHALAQFKREFRALAGVSHVNLVGLRELYQHAGTWFIAMELIEGPDLLSWVRTQSEAGGFSDHGFDERRLRTAFAGVAEGLLALHSHGLLHRDLKPSNVRITHEARAVLLDFGLVTTTDQRQQSTHESGAGTAAYMAPEQATGGKLGAAVDLYAFGACLYEALTGCLPFDEPSSLALMLRKTQEDPLPPRARCPSVPEDLDWLCTMLLDRVPEHRLPLEGVVRTLVGSFASSARAAPKRESGPIFEGRVKELASLAEAMARTHEGELSLVFIEGESGIGKSALLAEAMSRELVRAPQTLVVASRCYEHERVPYKAFDGCADALASALRKLPDNVCEALLPRHAGLLGELFPVLKTVKPLSKRALHGAPAEPGARRREAFRVFAELLGRLAENRPVALVIDDLQWADQESFKLLRALTEERPPPVLIACSVRPTAELSAEARAAFAKLRAAEHTRWMTLTGLVASHTETLARRLLGAAASLEAVHQIAYESHGHPMLIAELSHYALERGAAPERLTLDAALGARIETLPAGARTLLEVLAVSDRPRPESFFASATLYLHDAGGFGDALTTLLAMRLARRNAALELLPAHDRIRAAVLSRGAPEHLRGLHCALAAELSRSGQGEASERALHWDRGGDGARALPEYIRAAAEALEALAFSRVVEHCTRALELVAEARAAGADEAKLPAAETILTQRAQAFAALGRSVEAAADFERAAASSEGVERVRLRVLAAQHQIQGTQFAAGMENARAVLAELGVQLPRGMGSSIVRILWERARMGLRGLGIAKDVQASAQDKLLLDAADNLIFPLDWFEPLPGLVLNMQRMRRALDLGEAGHAAQALAHEAIGYVMRGKAGDEPLFAVCEELLTQTDDPIARSFVRFEQGVAELLKGQPSAARAHCEAAEAVLVSSCPGEVWQLSNVRMILGCALFQSGEHVVLNSNMARWLGEAQERRDAFASAALLGIGFGFMTFLMRDAPDEAVEAIRQSVAPWKDQPYGFAQHGELLSRSMSLSYAGRGDGWNWFVDRAKEHDRALIHLAGPTRDLLNFCYTLADTSRYASANTEERQVLLRRLGARARKFSSFGFGQVAGPLASAQFHALRGDLDAAIGVARRGHALCLEAGHTSYAQNAAYLLGTLEGGESGRALRDDALAFFRDRGWADPWRAATMFAPAARLLEDSPAPPKRARGEALFHGRYRWLPSNHPDSALRNALDTRTGRTVTLQVLTDAAPEAIARFKQEFRALQSVHHENLARLEALFEHEGVLTTVMERVPESDFLSFVRPGDVLQMLRLQIVLRGMLSALRALHDAGFVHGDLQPKNVRVTPEGRVVLVGRGLAMPLDVSAREPGSGALADYVYAAPEQLSGQDFGAPVDVYAAGVCLYQALTGLLPFNQLNNEKLLEAKRRGRPIPPWALRIELPSELEQLCLAMLEREPNSRPTVSEALAHLEGEIDLNQARRARRDRVAASLYPTAPESRAQVFTGRLRELAWLDDCVERSARGACVLALVRGESGVGKTTLVSEAIERVRRAAPQTLVLQSRCYANEQLGHQAFDGAVDGLARVLRKLPREELMPLLPPKASLLAQLFPVLGSVSAIVEAPKKGLPAEPNVRRNAALEAFVRLIEQISKRWHLVFVIDDLQWADAESFHLLTALMTSCQGARLTFLATARPGEARDDTVQRELDRIVHLPGAEERRLERFNAQEATALGAQLLGDGVSEEQLALFVRESDGHPLFMRELGSYLQRAGSPGQAVDLNQALAARIAQLAPEARCLLDLIALAARPYPPHVLERALGPHQRFDDALRFLFARELVHRRGDAAVTCFHDRLREVAVALLSAEQRRALCAQLADAIDAEPESDPGERARLWDAAGEPARAIVAYVQAVESACEAFAFGSAEKLCSRALELQADADGATRAPLLILRARTLVALGKSAEAAELYTEAAQHAEGSERVRLRVLAAQHQIQSAQFEAGLKNASAVLAELNVPFSRGAAGSITRILWERARAKLRGYRVAEHREISAWDKLTLEALSKLNGPVFWAEFLPGSAIGMHYLRRALVLGEPGHAAQALASEALSLLLQDEHRDQELFAKCDELLAQTHDPVAQAWLLGQRGLVALFKENPGVARVHCEAAEALLVSSCPGEAWRLVNARMSLGCAFFLGGEHARLYVDSQRWLAEAKERRDVFAVTALLGFGFGFASFLMRDEPAEALEALIESMEPWKGLAYGIAHHGELIARSLILTYRGRAEGWSWFVDHLKTHERALIHRTGPTRDLFVSNQVLAEMCVGDTSTAEGRAALERNLFVHARKFSSGPYGQIFAPLIRAQAHVFSGAIEQALEEAKRGQVGCVEHGQVCHRHAADYMVGAIEGGEGGKVLRDGALAFFRDQGWKDPWRAATSIVPAIRWFERGSLHGE